jgi:thiamine kinase-like enzyme
MSRVPGSPLGSKPLTIDQIAALTTALRRLFSAPAALDAEERAFGPSVMRSVIREWAREEYDLRECRDPALVGRALTLARRWLASDDAQHDRVTDAVLALRDGNLENIMWDGTTCRLIDFEEFGISDIAYELADMVEHVSSRLRHLMGVDAFLDQFPLGTEQQTRLAIFRQLMASF